jgi:hypothetical protein
VVPLANFVLGGINIRRRSRCSKLKELIAQTLAFLLVVSKEVEPQDGSCLVRFGGK